MGLVEIFGKVVPIENNLLNSPFSDTECVYYKYKIERWVKRNDKHYWQTVSSGKTSLPFKLEDNTGSVLIDPVGANIDINSTTYTSSTGKDPSFIIQKFLNSNNFAEDAPENHTHCTDANSSFNVKYRWPEAGRERLEISASSRMRGKPFSICRRTSRFSSLGV